MKAAVAIILVLVVATICLAAGLRARARPKLGAIAPAHILPEPTDWTRAKPKTGGGWFR